jgi:drug/metabolite transporter (DMT)-like permease
MEPLLAGNNIFNFMVLRFGCHQDRVAICSAICDRRYRFFIAGLLMLIFAHGIKGYRMPRNKEWKQIMIYGLLNVSIYLGLYIISMQKISAGLGTLAVAMNPVFISFMAAFIFKKPVGVKNIISLMLCFTGSS